VLMKFSFADESSTAYLRILFLHPVNLLQSS